MNDMRYLHAEGMWLLPSPEGFDCEILVEGDEAGPQPEQLALINTAIASLHELCTRGISYLESFLDRTKVAPGDSWNLVGLNAERREVQPDQFMLHYVIEDDVYGDWFVTFQRSNGRDFPVAFGRRQM